MQQGSEMRLGSETALTFVLNRKYIRPLKVLLFSLMRNGSLQGCPVELLTDDSWVARDPLLRRLAANIHLVPPEELEPFGRIRGERIPEHLRVPFAPKYTFLKFLIFRPRGYARHIFMDCDMLCLNPLDEALLAEPYDSKAIREIGSSLFPMPHEPKYQTFSRDRSLSIVEAASQPQPVEMVEGINSGFMVLQGKALGEHVFAAALDIASSEAFPAEQPATTEVLRRVVQGRHLKLPIWYNARRRMFECLGEAFFEAHRGDIRLLHFTPGKPWSHKPEERRFLDHVWFGWEAASQEWANDLGGSMV